MKRATREELLAKGRSKEGVDQYEENGRVIEETRAWIKEMEEIWNKKLGESNG